MTTDHKRIAILYMISVTLFFFVGGAAAVLFRLELMTPRGDLVIAETYNKLFTLHGVIMVFFFLIPSIPTVLGNFLLPMMIGARDLAFPRLNLASWYIFMTGGLMAVGAIVAGGADTGWTFYTPYSSTYTNTNVMLMALGGVRGRLFVDPHRPQFHRHDAHDAGPGADVVSPAAVRVVALRHEPDHGARHAGDRDHAAAWWRSNAVWASAFSIPSWAAIRFCSSTCSGFTRTRPCTSWCCRAMGVMSEIVPASRATALFGYTFVAFASLAIAVIGFFVWGHHMFVSGQSMYAGMIFSILSMLVAVPSAVKVFNWTATLYRGSVSLETPMLYALGFIGLFTLGGLTGLFLATLAVDVHVHDTYFIVAHFHYIMVGGAVMGYLGGIHFWWPKMTGRMYPEWWGRLSAGIIFIGFNLTFFPQFVLGYLGMPRRVHEYVDEFQVLNVMSSAGASILGVGYLIPLAYLIWSLRYGPVAGRNPWRATGTGMADRIAADDVQFRDDACRRPNRRTTTIPATVATGTHGTIN